MASKNYSNVYIITYVLCQVKYLQETHTPLILITPFIRFRANLIDLSKLYYQFPCPFIYKL